MYLDNVVFTTGIADAGDHFIVASGEADLACRITHVPKEAFVPSELLALIVLLPLVVLMYRMTAGPKRLLLLGAILDELLRRRGTRTKPA